MHQPNLVEYNIQHFREMCTDISNRTKLITDFRTLIERRLKIDIEYANKVKQFMNCSQMKKMYNSPSKSSQIFYNCLINSLKSEGDNIANYKLRLVTEIQGLIDSKLTELEGEVKKNMNTGIGFEKQFMSELESMEKLKNKYLKKCAQMRKQKEEYIVGFLSDMPLYNKNKLYLKIKEAEDKQLAPLHKQFMHHVHLFNQYAQIYSGKMNKVIEKGSQLECVRIETMKNAYMILQIAKSQYGANMVSQNNILLTKLNEYANGYPDFKLFSSQAYKESQIQMLQQKIDPNKYINTLFSNIDSKLTENLILYGTSKKQKVSLENSLIGEEGLRDLSDDEVNEDSKKDEPWLKDTQIIEEVGICFRNIFSQEEEADPQKLKQLQRIMVNDFQARKSFILCFQKFRWAGKYEISNLKIKQISQIMKIFLDQCFEEKDTYNSKMLMILSLTYFVKKGDEKIDLHYYIKDHHIWKDKDWWECALLESVYQHTKIKKKLDSHNQVTLWHIKGSYSKGAQGEGQVTFQHVFFNQMLYYITNMNLFGLEKNKIIEVVKKYVKYFSLGPAMISDLQACLNTGKSEHSFIDLSDVDTKVDSPNKKCNSNGSIKSLFS